MEAKTTQKLNSDLVKLFKTNIHGRDQILSINKPGDFINLLTIFSNDNYRYSISTLEETKVCVIELSVIKQLIKSLLIKISVEYIIQFPKMPSYCFLYIK